MRNYYADYPNTGWFFTSTYDLSNFTESELNEIKKGYGSLEAYACEMLCIERDKIFAKAREIDMHLNLDVLCKTEDKRYIRFSGLEDALRNLLKGECKLGRPFKRDTMYVYSDGMLYKLKWITPKERVYVSDKIDKYSKEYLEFLDKNKLTSTVYNKWYYGPEDNNIEKEEVYKVRCKRREKEDSNCKAQDNQESGKGNEASCQEESTEN